MSDKKPYAVVETPHESVPLSFFQLLKACIFDRVNLGPRTKEDWSGSMDFYLFKCRRNIHGWVVDYVHGGRNLVCPLCVDEDLKER